jgi:hypothetical protein
MSALIGIEIGPASTAICVVEPERRDDSIHFLVRHLERLPPSANYIQLGRRYTEVVDRLATKTDLSVHTYINVTHAGAPVVTAFQKRTGAWSLRSVYFNHGAQRIVDEKRNIQLGKGWLVSRLKVLLPSGQIHLTRTHETEILHRDLDAYRPNLPEDAATRYGAFRVGTQDDLINALGLAVQEDIAPSRPEDQAAIDEGFAQAPMTEVGAILDMYKKLGL